MEDRQPRALLTEALARFDRPPTSADARRAIDLGCGDGTETLALLQHGWTVLAIDSEPAAIARVRSKVPAEYESRLETRVASFGGLDLPPADLVYAGFSLPFCPPAAFDRLWSNIAASLRPGARFAGQLFGNRDSWFGSPGMTFHTSEQVAGLLIHAFEVESLQEDENDRPAFSGPKHWHVFHILARSTGASATRT